MHKNTWPKPMVARKNRDHIGREPCDFGPVHFLFPVKPIGPIFKVSEQNFSIAGCLRFDPSNSPAQVSLRSDSSVLTPLVLNINFTSMEWVILIIDPSIISCIKHSFSVCETLNHIPESMITSSSSLFFFFGSLSLSQRLNTSNFSAITRKTSFNNQACYV